MIRILFFTLLYSMSFTLIAQEDIIVQLQKGEKITHLLRDRASDTQLKKTLSSRLNIHLITTSSPTLYSDLQRTPEVLHIQYDMEVSPRNTPNDEFYPEQWSLEHIKVTEVWDLNTGGLTPRGDTIVIAIIDSGYDITHPDLQNNIWYNHAEIPGDGIDNDDNGYIDDIVGWNYQEDQAQHLPRSHGQGVAGIVGAQGNNEEGVSGINWNIKMMLFSCGNSSQIIAAYEYIIHQRNLYNTTAGEEGAFVVSTNLSLGISNKFCEEFPIWGGMYDQLGEVGILTAGAPPNSPDDIGVTGDMPTTCPSPYLISVMNTTDSDEKYSGSAYSNAHLDLGVPGADSYTTGLDGGYRTFGGNSAAAPHLSSSIALLYSIGCENVAEDAINHPAETALKFREYILNGVQSVSDLEQYTITGGRIDVWQSAQLLFEDCEQTKGPLDIVKVYPLPADDLLTIEVETPDFEQYQFTLYNMLGQKVWESDYTPNFFGKKTKQLDTSLLAMGTYTLVLSKGKEVKSKKIVVHR